MKVKTDVKAGQLPGGNLLQPTLWDWMLDLVGGELTSDTQLNMDAPPPPV